MSGSDASPKRTAKYTSATDSRFIENIRSNVKSDLIEITEDKLENILLKHLSNLAVRGLWWAPLSLLLPAVLANLTATFQDAFGIPPSVWQGIFRLLAVGSLVWLASTLIRRWAYRKKCSLDYVIGVIKNAHDEPK